MRLFSWVAGIMLALAAVWFLGYSVRQGWLQPPVRVAIGIIVGVALLAICELKAARTYPVTANAMDGAAVVILFSTFFAGCRLWDLYGLGVAFGLLALVTVVAVLLSIRRDSVFIALLGLVGGFSTPALLSTGQDNPFGLFGYLLMLNAGLALVAYRKRWPLLVALSMLLTTVYQWGWVATFLTPGKLPIAAAIFLVFPILGFVGLALGHRTSEAGTGTTGRRSWFDEAASLNGALPLLFALFMATSPAYGDHAALLFGFLFCLDAGLFAVALWRGPSLLHLLGGLATLLVFVSWITTNYPTGQHNDNFQLILAFVALFVAFYLAAGLTARHGTRRLSGPGTLAAYAAPLLLFAFPVLAGAELEFASPGLPFAVLFVLLGAVAAFAVSEEAGPPYFIAAFMALGTEAIWSANYLTEARLLPALVIYGGFGLFYLAVPLIARRLGRALQPEGLGGGLLLVSIALLFFLSNGPMAPGSLWGLALLLAILNVALLVEGKFARLPLLPVAGTLLSWLVLAAWWASGALAGQIVPAMAVMAGFTMLTLGGHLWAGANSAGDDGPAAQAGPGLALVGHVFLLFVASQPSLSVPPWPMLGVLALLDAAVAAAALYTRRAELHIGAMGFSQVVVMVWIGASGGAQWPLIGMISAAAVAAFGLAWAVIARRRVTEVGSLDRFDAAAAVGLVLGQFALVVASTAAGAPHVGVLMLFHALLLTGLLGLAATRRWHILAVFAVVPTWFATWWWQASHAGAPYWWDNLVFAAPIYLMFVAYPLVIGRRVEKSTEPYVAAVLASGSFFHVGRLSFYAAGWDDVIGALPLAQAGLMALLLVSLLRLERPGDRPLGRLALVAGTLLGFITVAIPLQLDKEWVTIGWALEGAALAWLFRRIPHRGLFWSALGLLAVVFVRLALNPEVLVYHVRSGVLIFNWYLYTYLICAASMMVAGRMFATTDDALPGSLRGSRLLPAAGTVLLFLLMNIEIADFYATGPNLSFKLSAGLAQNLTYTLGWGAFAVCLLSVGIVVQSHAARLAAIVLLTIAVLKGFLSDVSRLSDLYRVMSFVGLAICLSLVALVLQRFVLAPRKTGAGRR